MAQNPYRTISEDEKSIQTTPGVRKNATGNNATDGRAKMMTSEKNATHVQNRENIFAIIKMWDSCDFVLNNSTTLPLIESLCTPNVQVISQLQCLSPRPSLLKMVQSKCAYMVLFVCIASLRPNRLTFRVLTFRMSKLFIKIRLFCA